MKLTKVFDQTNLQEKGSFYKILTKSIELMENKMSKGASLEGDGFSYYFRALAYIKLNKSKLACIDLNKAKDLGFPKADEEILKNCTNK